MFVLQFVTSAGVFSRAYSLRRIPIRFNFAAGRRNSAYMRKPSLRF